MLVCFMVRFVVLQAYEVSDAAVLLLPASLHAQGTCSSSSVCSACARLPRACMLPSAEAACCCCCCCSGRLQLMHRCG